MKWIEDGKNYNSDVLDNNKYKESDDFEKSHRFFVPLLRLIEILFKNKKS